jgi:hypothetical protein
MNRSEGGDKRHGNLLDTPHRKQRKPDHNINTDHSVGCEANGYASRASTLVDIVISGVEHSGRDSKNNNKFIYL